ncbi:MAG: wax ester/triacylglycerol synthase family O-acyltransferase [Gammaproteobacteria bacterium]|nr:wax ester/triacylglycerol synthase family O-acyltransferase [Gammaproteobacteria bacterium]MDH3767886.1 wax ester/triacylglycerol synthase family O-acyltransferase [Gammaproteobacteria bacterium]
MEQLSGLDAGFLYLETGNMPMHIGSLAIYDQSTAPGGHVGFKDILSYFEERLHKARAFRQRLARVPLGLDHPYWIEDPDFDLEFHIRHIALPQPGDWRQLCIQTARLHARPLDRNRPLWEAWVIEGLDNVPGVPQGSFALVTKFHHAAVDGVSAAAIAAAFHDLSPDATTSEPENVWQPDRFPTSVELLARGAVNTLRQPLAVAKLTARNLPTLLSLGKGLLTNEFGMKIKVPRTRFNDNVSAHRVFDGRTFSLDEIRTIKESVANATVNDVVVSFCGGALRKYLQSKNELPEESLVAMAPVSARPKSKHAAAGNMISTMSLPVCSNIADPLERLRAVNAESRRAKKLTSTMGAPLAAEAAQFLPSTTTGLFARAYARAGLAKRLPPIYNTIITNVPGVNAPLYSMGSKMVASFGLGPVAHGLGLFQPVVGYNHEISISAISCREMMPDPSFYCDCLEESFEELKASAVKKAMLRGKEKHNGGGGKRSEAPKPEGASESISPN